MEPGQDISQQLTDKQTPVIVRKFIHAQLYSDPSFYEPEHFRETYYFFYGTLMDPVTLAQVLNYPTGLQPEVRPTYMEGHPLKMWGEYPAVVNEFVYQRISGVAYKVKSEKEVDRLVAYETHMYRGKGCRIHFEDHGTRARGVTFIWNTDLSLLSEGSFDLERWLEKKKMEP